jgi:hypothetical protein
MWISINSNGEFCLQNSGSPAAPVSTALETSGTPSTPIVTSSDPLTNFQATMAMDSQDVMNQVLNQYLEEGNAEI